MKKNYPFFKNIVAGVKSNYFVFIIAITFSLFSIPACLQNNDYLNLVTSEHIDTGSLINSIFQMTNKTSFYNQNVPFHTLYGFPYNSTLFFVFITIKSAGFNTQENFTLFVATARLFNYLLSIFIIFEIYFFSKRLIGTHFFALLTTLLTIIFPPFILYSYHIKPDLMGLLFILLSMKYLYLYLIDTQNTKQLIKANVFGALSVLCKQPNIFILIPLIYPFICHAFLKDYFYLRRLFWVYIKSFVIFLSLFFLIHPYAFIDINSFIAKQNSLVLGNASTNIIDNIHQWYIVYINSPYLLLTLLSPILYLIYFLTNTHKQEKKLEKKFLLNISMFSLIFQFWTILKVGPIRIDAYLLPVFSFSILIFFFITKNFLNHREKLLFIIKISIISVLVINISKPMLTNSYSLMLNSYKFKQTPQYLASTRLTTIVKETYARSIVYSASLPINSSVFKKAENNWQFGPNMDIKSFQPDIILIDFGAWWEKPYPYWKKIALDNQLDKENVLITNGATIKIVLFYK